jgi:hypothetical protein
MERRLEIYNKIKNTKISKLTLKQNGEAKTLNLKVDLINENIFLSDKALDMLENLANRQIAIMENSSPIKKQPQPEEPPHLIQTIFEPIPPEPVVTLNKPTQISTFIDQITNSQIEIKSNNEITRLDEPTTTTTDSQFLCRLCQAKCPNERALHDHVTRIHGGSDSRRKHYLFLNNNNNSLYEQDTNSDTNDDLTNNISSKNVKNKKYKLMEKQYKEEQQQAKKISINSTPKPSVAIRVAKVAYYNNKNSLTTSNSKIFVNGIRGNFFSQERLPLKSCKIKLGINEQTKENPTKLPAAEVNKFFRSLLVYIPNEILTIDDLIKTNNLNDMKKQLIEHLHSIILDSKECGITLYCLKIKISIESMNLLMEMLDILLKNYLILSVGVCERVYVAHEFCQPWIILSYKNQKGCNYSSTTIVETPPPGLQVNTELLLKQKQYKTVWLIPRPWRYIDGLLNRQMLEKVFESIVLFLKMNPKVTFENISLHYSPVLQPIMTLELLEMLVNLNCVTCIRLKRETECNLESSFDHGSIYVVNNDELFGNEICLYECNPDSIFILKQIFSS